MPTPDSLEEVIVKALKPQYGVRGAEALVARWWTAMRKAPRHRRRKADRTYWRAQALLAGAEFYIDAERSKVVGGKLTNLGTGGSALDATFGSTTGTDTNDPTLLVHSGTNYLYLPGVAGNYASAPDSAALDITGDLDMAYRVAADDWTPSGFQCLGGNFALTHGFGLWLRSPDGFLHYAYSNGVAGVARPSTVAVPATDGQALWVRVTHDVDNGAGGNTVTFYTAPDQDQPPTTWTQLGAPNVAAGVVSLPTGASQFFMGMEGGNASMFSGKFYRAIVRNGIGGTTVFDADFTRGITSGGQTSFVEASSNAATVTINRATSGRKAVAVVRNVLLLGTDDYLEVADNALLNFALTDNFSVVAIVRQWATTADKRIIAKTAAAGGNWYMAQQVTDQVYFAITDTVVFPSAAKTLSPGVLGGLVGVRNVTADTVGLSLGGTLTTTTDTTTGSLTNTGTMRIGAQHSGVFGDFEIVAAAVFRRALTAAEVADIVNYYNTVA